MDIGYDELNTRLRKFRDRKAAIPGAVEELQDEAAKINLLLGDGDLEPSSVTGHRKRLEEIASEIGLLGEDDGFCEERIAVLGEQFGKLDHSWATRSGIFRKRDQELAAEARQHLAFFLEVCEARKENSSAWQDLANRIGLDPITVFGWRNVRNEINSLLGAVCRRLKMDPDRIVFSNTGRHWLSSVPELIDGKEAEAN